MDYLQFKVEFLKGTVSCEAQVKAFIEQINAYKHLNVFLEVYEEEALLKARELDRKRAEGLTLGKLAGMVIGLKDILAYKDHPLEACSKILKGFKSQFTATAVQRILDEDAIIIGRQNCDEFAMGSSTENSAYGSTRNFADPERVPGGSSGASAVAVQAGMCHASLGSDTGGSVRQPAGFCGVVGLKPTYGRVSRWGLAAYASSFDCIGPIANTVKEVALILETIAGWDGLDSSASPKVVEDYADFGTETKRYKIGYLKEAFESEGLDPHVKELAESKIIQLKESGHELIALQFPEMKYLLPTYYILTMAEASSNLQRYDGIKYGHRSSAVDLENLYKTTREEGFGAEVKRRIMLGTFILNADYYDAYYTKAQRVRNMVRQKTESFFKDVNFIVSPTTPTPAFKIGEKRSNPLEMFLMDVFTVHANVIGYPSISIPMGVTPEGLPTGLQILGTEFEEKQMLAFANSI